MLRHLHQRTFLYRLLKNAKLIPNKVHHDYFALEILQLLIMPPVLNFGMRRKDNLHEWLIMDYNLRYAESSLLASMEM